MIKSKLLSPLQILTPFQKFVKIESLSGILLFGAMIVALVWANSPWKDSYHELWDYEFGVKSDDIKLVKPLILWINDGLMAIFFFLIGLEIKREVLIGELNSMKKAAFPIFGAIGGMLLPITLFLVMNKNPDASHGWGIPMATDIAFSLAILKLLGNKIPIGLKVFLTAFAIVDDIGAVLVIAIFYSVSVKGVLLLIALGLILILWFLSSRGFYSVFLWFGMGIIIWFLFLKAGLHPTIAGVLCAFTVPIRRRTDVKTFTQKLSDIVERFKSSGKRGDPLLSKAQIHQLDYLEEVTRQVQSPLQHLEHRLHKWVAYYIMPVFALANAGVTLGEGMILDTGVVITLMVSLVAGNCIGIGLMTFLGLKLKLTTLPQGVGSWHILGVSLLAGVGFTMSIFIANLAYADHLELMDSAKVGILAGSAISGIAGYLVLRFAVPNKPAKS